MSERTANTGEAFTSRQRRLLDSEFAKEKFKDTHHVFLLVEQVRSKMPECEDWMPKAVILEQNVYMQSQSSFRFSVDVSSSSSERVPIEVDCLKLVHQLPRAMLLCIMEYDNPSSVNADATPQDLCDIKLKTKSFLDLICNSAEVLLCFIQNVMMIADSKRHEGRLQADWGRFRNLMLRSQGPSGEAAEPTKDEFPYLLTEGVDLLNACLCKLLGPLREQFKKDVTLPGGDWSRARTRIKTVMLLLLAVEKLSLATAMEVNNIKTYAKLPAPASDHFFHYLFQGRNNGYQCVSRVLKFSAVLYKVMRTRCLAMHLDLPKAPGARPTQQQLEAVDSTRRLALITALVLEPLERLLQSRPMENVLENLGVETNFTVEILGMTKAGMSMLSPNLDEPERQIYSCALMKSADERAGKPHLPSRLFSGDIELLVARAHVIFAHVTKCIAPSLQKRGAATETGQWWTDAIPDWFDAWMVCAYNSISLASKVITRKWPREGEAFPEGQQPYEGQLSINAMRSAAAVCQSGCRALVNCKDEQNPFYRVWCEYQVLTVALRARLAMKEQDMMSVWCCGELGRRLFCEELFRVSPVSCKLRDAYGELCCLEGTDMRPFLDQHYPASEVVAEGGNARNKKARKRPEDELEVVLQACEMGVQAWRILQGMISLELQTKGSRFDDTCMAQMLESLVKQFTTPQKPQSQVWRRVGLRVQNNVIALSEHYRRVETHVCRSNPALLRQRLHDMDVLLSQFTNFLEGKGG